MSLEGIYIMSKQTQYFKLFMLLKGAPNGISKEELGIAMSVSAVSVPVYIFELKKQFKCEIESVRKGKQVVAYKLVNGDKVKVPEHRRGSLQPVAKLAVKAAPLTGEAALEADSEHDITRVGDREMADIRSSLGIGSFGGRGSSDY
jgi:biotin operon repressor